jgi:hypothetical protein
MTLSFFFQNAWRWKVGIPEKDWEIDTDGIENHTWSNEFERYQRNRLLMGELRYGRVLMSNRPQFDRLEGMKKYIKKYEETGNLECLVDVANYCMLEYLEGNHPNKHFSSTEVDQFHVKQID